MPDTGCSRTSGVSLLPTSLSPSPPSPEEAPSEPQTPAAAALPLHSGLASVNAAHELQPRPTKSEDLDDLDLDAELDKILSSDSPGRPVDTKIESAREHPTG